jgi:AcrR family transcriptional regulator
VIAEASKLAKATGTVKATAKPVKQRLIDAGERLFAEHGLNGVGIRTIAEAADVSLAALNYHFGEKENLLAEIFAERARPIAAERMRLLAEIEASGTITLERVIEAFLRPAFGAGSEARFKLFAKLRARLATESEAFKGRIRATAFDESSRRYIAALQALLPELSPQELGWRFHFLLGAMLYTMADAGRIQSLTDGKCDPGDVQAVMSHIVPFMAAGFRSAPPPGSVRRKPRKK